MRKWEDFASKGSEERKNVREMKARGKKRRE